MLAPADMTVAQRLLGALPQTQCTRCGYPDCAAYAQAIAVEAAPINQCPPGGAEGIQRLADIMRQTSQDAPPHGAPLNPSPSLAPNLVLNPANGTEGPRAVAVIDENWCIGCTLCIDICPTDAILGSNKLMHTVMEPYCTGCELCLPVCPVDCIVMENANANGAQAPTGWAAWSQPLADQARQRYAFRSIRLAAKSATKAAQTVTDLEATLADLPGHSRIEDPALLEKKRSVVEGALARARLKSSPARPAP